ncbi:uncharacterized protein LOC132593093 [Zootoca vivipara]|uniref:uncharacterized protein LOC132593093 n=1 Tax=Zootoca vivipara TaxID=8524 RepID=UPI00293BC760|nr:uncharacterized protein LOC132593093 [Zootoca vivipara]
MTEFSKVREPFPNVYFVLVKSLERRGCLPDDDESPLTGRPQRMLWRRAIEKPSLEVVGTTQPGNRRILGGTGAQTRASRLRGTGTGGRGALASTPERHAGSGQGLTCSSLLFSQGPPRCHWESSKQDLSPRSSAQCPVLPCFNDPFFLAGSPVCTTGAAAQASPKRAARERLSLGAAASWEGLEPRQGLLPSEDLLSAPLWLLPKPPIKRTGTSARRIPSPSSSTGPRFKIMVSITSTQADGQRVRLHLPLRSSLAFLNCKVLPSRWRKPFCSVPCMSSGMPRMLSECASF